MVDQKSYNASKVDELAVSLMRHKRLYYSGKPEISDHDYDKLEKELTILAPNHPVLSFVGTDEAVTGRKVEHRFPMLSLQKSYEKSDLFSWVDNREIVGTWKIDGNSLAIIYKEGKVEVAKTRGNGRVGEDVTEKAVWVGSIVPDLGEEVEVEVRGELVCSLSQFAELSKEMESLGLEKPSNPRNIVAGILGRKNFASLARFFTFFAFDVISVSGDEPFSTEMEKFAWFEKMGFSLPYPKLLSNEAQIDGYLKEVKETISDQDIALDGAVFSYNDVSLHKELGNTSHHPRYKMSFKWQGETAITTISEIKWQTSRQGIVTPVAIVESVNLSGANITNVTLHNCLNVRNFNLKIGDKIEIVRSGEVIPKFLRVAEESLGHYSEPEVCPSCGENLSFDDVRLRCTNQNSCPAQKLRGILNWIKSAEIDDLSEKRLANMLDIGLIENIDDLYRLEVEDLLKLPTTKEKMANKLLSNIRSSCELPLVNFLNGLGVEGVGMTGWERLLERFPSLDAVLNASSEDIIKVDGFAEKLAKQIVAGLKRKGELIKSLLDVGVKPSDYISQAEEGVGDDTFQGKMIAITGKLSMPRSEMEKIIKSLGGKPASSISKNTHLLIANDPQSSSSKMKKARDLEIPIWTEEDLQKYISGRE